MHCRITTNPSQSSKPVNLLEPEWQVSLSVGKKKSAPVRERCDHRNFNHKVTSLDNYLREIAIGNDFHQYARVLLSFLERADLKHANNVELLLDRLGWLLLENREAICHQSGVEKKDLKHTVISLFILSIAYTVSSDNAEFIKDDQQITQYPGNET